MTQTTPRVFPPQPGDIIRCCFSALRAIPDAGEPWYEQVDIEGHWRSETTPGVFSVLHRRKAHPDHIKSIPVNMTTGESRQKFPPGSILRVFHTAGGVAEVRVYTDGSYYGQADVERGDATVEIAYEVPEDVYSTWVAEVAAEHLVKLEAAFRLLADMYGGDLSAVNNVIQLLGSYVVHAHFRRWGGLL